jgi:hypothetical protein
MGHVGISMTVRYSHLVPEHKAPAVAKLGDRFTGIKSAASERPTVSPQLKEVINGAMPANLEQNRNIFLMRLGRGLKIVSSDSGLKMARDGIEPPTRGFSELQATRDHCGLSSTIASYAAKTHLRTPVIFAIQTDS